jgi:hypothetical protein
MTSEKRKKKPKKTRKGVRTKVAFVPVDDKASEEKESDERFDESGMFLEKEDVKLIYNALSAYKPSQKEDHLHGVLLEQFEEVLVVDYGEP